MKRLVTVSLVVVNLALLAALSWGRLAADSVAGGMKDCCEGPACCIQCCVVQTCDAEGSC